MFTEIFFDSLVRPWGQRPSRPNQARRLFADFTRRARARADADHLEGLPDHLLRDIGLTRAAVREACQRRR